MRYVERVYAVDGSVVETALDGEPTLERMQAAVGGLVQPLPHWDEAHPGEEAYVNEEGAIFKLPRNDRATEMWRRALGYDGDPCRWRYEPTVLGPMVVYESHGETET